MQRKDISRIESVHRAILLLKLISQHGSISVTEAARQLEVNPSTVSRILDTLRAEDFVVQGKKRRYYPGHQFLGAGRNISEPTAQTRLRPHLERLYVLSRETVHLASLVGAEVHHLDCIEARQHSLVFTNRMEKRLPAHIAAQGKSMLAEFSRQEVDERYASLAFAGQVISEAAMRRLHEELDHARRNGFATNFEGTEKGIAALAVSVGSVNGQHLSLSVALPIARYSVEVGRELREALLTVKAEARKELDGEFVDR